MRTSIVRLATWTAAVLMVAAATASPALATLPAPSVPEIDPGSAVSAVTLLMGGALLLTDRLRRRS